MKTRFLFLLLSSISLFSLTDSTFAYEDYRMHQHYHTYQDTQPEFRPSYEQYRYRDDRNRFTISINIPASFTDNDNGFTQVKRPHRPKRFYVCQTHFRGAVYRGRIDGDVCIFNTGRRELATPYYRVLVN